MLRVVKIYVENDNVVSMFSNVAQINVEIENVDSALFNVVNFNVYIDNVISTLIWRCTTSWRHINLKQRWNNINLFAGKTALLYVAHFPEWLYIFLNMVPILFLHTPDGLMKVANSFLKRIPSRNEKCSTQ